MPAADTAFETVNTSAGFIEHGRHEMSLRGREQSRDARLNAAVSVLVAGTISSAHHVYGALLYETPWRMIVSLWIPGFVLLVLSMLYLHGKHAGRLAAAIAAWIILFAGVIFHAGFTMFECVYSHVLKNVLFFGGASQSVLERLFPAPAYHLPYNLLFELTGFAQLAGFWAAWRAWQVFAIRSTE